MDMMLDDALTDINIAFLQVEFSIELLSYCELKKIDPENIDTNETVLLEHDSLTFPPGHFRKLEDIIRAAAITFSSALGASALTLDKGWEVAGIPPNPLSADESVKLCTLVYMVRCTYAHGSADPKWKVRGNFRQVLEVELPNSPLKLDLRELDGHNFSFDVIGGHARWFEIHDASVAAFSALAAKEGQTR